MDNNENIDEYDEEVAEFVEELQRSYNEFVNPNFSFDLYRDYYLERREFNQNYERWSGGGTEGDTDEASPHPDDLAPPP